jgi:hypothetical protein
MQDVSRRWVSKVHPATRAVEPEDPLTLNATPVAGDPDVMLRCVLQEYAWMGHTAEEILALFRDPFYPALRGMLEANGEEVIRGRIEAILARMGVFQVRATVRETPPPAGFQSEPVQIRIPEQAICGPSSSGTHASEGADHA